MVSQPQSPTSLIDSESLVAQVLPDDAGTATLVGRLLDPAVGPCVVAVRGDELIDITHLAPTTADLFDNPDRVAVVCAADGDRRWRLADVLRASFDPAGDDRQPRLLAPIDVQVLKAAGVTFARSMIERVIEERSAGDPDRAAEVRRQVADVVGENISVEPGTPQAEKAKQVLISEGLWSQYLEVGIGPDPEIFTKAPVLSAVGVGAAIGILARSTWNNPEPEMVLINTSAGEPVGATLGNDVNLRDFEGRSALLLAEAKDNNASCAIGPFVRLFDDSFGYDDAATIDVTLRISGPDGFRLEGINPVSEISRDPRTLVAHAYGDHHQYPDGFVLFTGTMFAPTEDRDHPGQGFTHKVGDEVSISSPRLGSLINIVQTAEAAPDWTVGVRSLMRNLAGRGLLATGSAQPS
ncbi:fumarylacetoacetate hydrolase family protein [Microlunatus soli]|uniref:Fumarylacetoacetate (FAA) hydrolase family protein n=1 Tax=Microlunatus soli TaxID=630515 RepID=A0A1H1XKB1_9ACTN|nr:fumarylacetoacetate hydrolase family protein [Microlunatus soli]SDT09670.1 Fumarylacetoacetate (FAA) hydrolase family protein [Microlunatus soli]